MAKTLMPHMLVFPYPAQGHMLPMLKLAELLSHAGFSVTFLNTESTHERLVKSSPASDQLSQMPRFRFRAIPDELIRDDVQSSVQVLDLEVSMRTQYQVLYKELFIPKDGQDLNGWPLVTCVTADVVVPAFEEPGKMGIPVMLLRLSVARSVWAYCCIPELIKREELPFPKEADMEDPIEGVGGMESFLRCQDVSDFLQHVKSVSPVVF